MHDCCKHRRIYTHASRVNPHASRTRVRRWHGDPPSRARLGPRYSEFFEYLNNGFYSRVSPCFYNLVGRKPTSYKEYLTTKGAAGDTGMDELFQAGMYTKGVDKFAHLKDVKKV